MCVGSGGLEEEEEEKMSGIGRLYISTIEELRLENGERGGEFRTSINMIDSRVRQAELVNYYSPVYYPDSRMVEVVQHRTQK